MACDFLKIFAAFPRVVRGWKTVVVV